MRAIVLLLVCLTCEVHAYTRQIAMKPLQAETREGRHSLLKGSRVGRSGSPIKALALFLVTHAPAVAFNPCNLGAGVVHGRQRRPERCKVILQYDDEFDDDAGYKEYDKTAQQFDLLSFKKFRRDTILQYDSTNQSEPLRIALTIIGILFGISVPQLGPDLQISDELTLNVVAVMSTLISGYFFARNRSARQARMEKIDKEYALGDLSAIYRGFQKKVLRDLRGKNRVVILFGTRAAVDKSLAEACVYRRRLVDANAIIVPIYKDESDKDEPSLVGEAESRWLWKAADTKSWKTYFQSLLSARDLYDDGRGVWVGLNKRGSTFGSALGMPRWDEVLGTGMQPSGDGFGEFAAGSERDAADAANEAAKAAQAFALPRSTSSASADDHANLLAAQAKFYKALTGGEVATMQSLWTDSKDDSSVDSEITEAAGGGAKIEPWEAGSPSFPPSGMKATDCDALILPSGEAWTTAVERPQEGGTLLATQRWRQDDAGGWRLEGHRYIPWSADGATAVLALRCDKRGCVLFGRQINQRAP